MIFWILTVLGWPHPTQKEKIKKLLYFWRKGGGEMRMDAKIPKIAKMVKNGPWPTRRGHPSQGKSQKAIKSSVFVFPDPKTMILDVLLQITTFWVEK